MDDSAHGDEPAEPKDAGPAKARPDMPLREPVAGAIPTVAPHPPRVPSQVPPWLEDTVTAGTPGDVPTAAADVPARVQDAMGPPPEVPVTPVTLEPSSPPPAEVADDDGLAEARAVNPAPEMPDQSAALELPALPADASDVGSREAHTTESELEVVAEPDQDAALTSQDVPPERVEGFLAAPFVGEAPVVPSPDFSHRAEADTERDAFPPIVPDIDILPAPPRESVDNAQPNALVSEVSAFDEGIWRDTAEVQQTVPALAVDAATQIIDTPPPAQQPAPIREEQIWSVLADRRPKFAMAGAGAHRPAAGTAVRSQYALRAGTARRSARTTGSICLGRRDTGAGTIPGSIASGGSLAINVHSGAGARQGGRTRPLSAARLPHRRRHRAGTDGHGSVARGPVPLGRSARLDLDARPAADRHGDRARGGCRSSAFPRIFVQAVILLRRRRLLPSSRRRLAGAGGGHRKSPFPARRQHHHHAGGQEPVSVAVPQLHPQGARDRAGLRGRGGLAQRARPGDCTSTSPNGALAYSARRRRPAAISAGRRRN